MRSFTWATARSHLSLFVALAAGRWCFTAGCHFKSLPLPPTPSQTEAKFLLNGGRKHKIVFLLQSKRCSQISTSYKYAAFRFWQPPILQTVHASIEPRLSTATQTLKRHRSVVLYSHSLCPSLKPLFQQRCLSTLRRPGRLQKNIRYPSCSQRQSCCHLKRENISTCRFTQSKGVEASDILSQ